jgi:hypothetical protein
VSKGCAPMGSRPKTLKPDSAPGTRSRPAPAWRGLPGTSWAWPVPARPLYGGLCRVVKPFVPGDPPSYKVCFGLPRSESNCWKPSMGSAPYGGPCL